MQLKFLKNHNQYKAGDIDDFTRDTAYYLIRCKVAVMFESLSEVENNEETPKKAAPKKAAKKK